MQQGTFWEPPPVEKNVQFCTFTWPCLANLRKKHRKITVYFLIPASELIVVYYTTCLPLRPIVHCNETKWDLTETNKRSN
jgi:hypothetical protein